VGVAGRALIITERVQRDDATSKSCRNLPYLTLLPPEGLNVYDVLRHDILIMTRNAVSAVEEAWKP